MNHQSIFVHKIAGTAVWQECIAMRPTNDNRIEKTKVGTRLTPLLFSATYVLIAEKHARYCLSAYHHVAGTLGTFKKQFYWLACSEASLNEIARQHVPSRATCKRWWGWLKERSNDFTHELTSLFPDKLGRCPDFQTFWSTCLDKMQLSKAMWYCHQNEVIVP